MKHCIVAIMLAGIVVGSMPRPSDARAVKGDMTLGLNMNYFSISSHEFQVCDNDGDDCLKTQEATLVNFGGGVSGGYLLTDLIELGIGVGVALVSGNYESAISDDELDRTDWDMTGSGYFKLHLGSSATLVPFVIGGLGLGVDGTTIKEDGYEYQSGAVAFQLFAAGGVDYYVGEKFAISGSLGITRWARADDSNTQSDANLIATESAWIFGFGLGVSTYF